MRHDKGVIQIGADVLVQPRAPRQHRIRQLLCLSVSMRSILLLLEQHIAALDKSPSRSRRSARS